MSQPTFGTVLRGMRLGFRWEPRYGCFVRLSGGSLFNPELLRLDIAPAAGPLEKLPDHHRFRVYWEGPDGGEFLLSLIQPLQALAGAKFGPDRLKTARTIYLNEDGTEKEPSNGSV